MTPYIHI